MTNVYMTNASEISLGNEEELTQKITQLTQENEGLTLELEEKTKQVKELQRKYDDIQMEFEHEKEITKNTENLLTFYKTQASTSSTNNLDSATDSENKIKDWEIKLWTVEERADEYEDLIQDLKKQIDGFNEEKKEMADLKDSMLNMLTEKEMENNDWKVKLEEYTSKNKPEQESEHERLNTEETKQLKEWYHDWEFEFEAYKVACDEQINKWSKKCDEAESAKHEVKRKNIDLESELGKLQDDVANMELERIQWEAKLKADGESGKNKQELLAEIERLQNQISDLKDSKDKILSTNEEKTSERWELEMQIHHLNEVNIDLEKQLQSVKIASSREKQATQEKHKNDLEQKEEEISKLHDSMTRVEQKLELFKKENEKWTTNWNEIKEQIKENKKSFDAQKWENDKKVNELQLKYDIEKSKSSEKIREQASKIEEVTKELTLLQQTGNNNNNNSLQNMLEEDTNSVDNWKKQIDAKDKEIFTWAQEKKYFEKTISELKRTLAEKSKSNTEAWTAENSFLTKSVETLNKQIEGFKTQREKDETYFRNEIKLANDSASNAKCQFATMSFEKDEEIIKLKRYVKRLQDYLQKMGVNITSKPKK